MAAKAGQPIIFNRFVMVDWSAAAVPGPPSPTKDQIWIGWCDAGSDAEPIAEYQRTRYHAENRIAELLTSAQGNTIVGFDFPFGFPAGTGLGGGRSLGARLSQLITDGPDNKNNRFLIASGLNAQLNAGKPGPFWGCPRPQATATLTTTRPDVFGPNRFQEHRITDHRLRHLGIQTCWKLAYPASVGSQLLMGMPVACRLAGRHAGKLWPFETAWNQSLGSVTVAEVWPRLFNHEVEPHEIKDARQVMAACRWMRRHREVRLLQALGRPEDLTETQSKQILTEEGWIVGAHMLPGG